MGYDKVVDSGALDGALTGIANAIRGKTGGTASLTLEQMPGAISGIETEPVLEELAVTENGEYTPGEGVDGFGRVTVEVPAAVPERTAWYRPPDWPDITSLPLSGTYRQCYYTVDKGLPGAGDTVCFFATGYSSHVGVEIGDIVDGVFVPARTYLNNNVFVVGHEVELAAVDTRFPVVRVTHDFGLANTSNNFKTVLRDATAPVVEVFYNGTFDKVYVIGAVNIKAITAAHSDHPTSISPGLGLSFWNNALEVLDLSGHTSMGTTTSRKLNNFLNGRRSLKYLRFPSVDPNSILLDAASQSDWPDSAFNGCESLVELDMSIFDASEVSRLTSVFNNCTSLRTLNLSGWNLSACTGMSNTFKGCTALENMITTGATMPSVSFSLSDSTLLSVDSLVGVIDALPVLAEGTTATLTLGAANTAKLTAEQISVATEKGWSVA